MICFRKSFLFFFLPFYFSHNLISMCERFLKYHPRITVYQLLLIHFSSFHYSILSYILLLLSLLPILFLIVYVVLITQTPYLQLPDRQHVCCCACQSSKTISWIISVENSAPLQILIQPQFKALFVFISTKSEPSPSFTQLLINVIDIKVVLASIPLICSHKPDLWLDRKHKRL